MEDCRVSDTELELQYCQLPDVGAWNQTLIKAISTLTTEPSPVSSFILKSLPSKLLVGLCFVIVTHLVLGVV